MTKIHMLLAAVLSLVVSVVVTVAPNATPSAEAQIDCSAVNTQIKLEICIVSYNLSPTGSTTTINITSDINYSSTIEPINNAAVPRASLIIDGNGHTLNANNTGSALQVASGEVSISHTELSNAVTGLQADGGQVTLKNSTVSTNRNGVYATGGDLLIDQSTITDNDFHGLWVDGGTVNVRSSTLVEAILGVGTRFVVRFSNGGLGIDDSLVAGVCNTALFNPGNAYLDSRCGTVTPGLDGTFGTLADNAPCATGTDCTPTIALLPGSPAIDGSPCVAGLLDQRGVARTEGKCDIGAYEATDCSSTMHVGDDEELAFALGCHKLTATGATDTTVVLTQDITVDSFHRVEHAAYRQGVTDVPNIVIDGAGHRLERGTSTASWGMSLQTPTRIQDLTITGFEVGLEVAAPSVLEGVTLESNDHVGVEYSEFGFLPSPTLTLDRSTIMGNGTAGISFKQALPLSLLQTTVVANGFDPFRDREPGGIIRPGTQSGVATITMVGSLIAGNQGAECAAGVAFTASSGNAIEDTSCGGVATAGLAGTIAAALAANGCSEPCAHTVALLAGSPAIDAHTGCTGGVDQRGATRTSGKCDAGAFELGDLDVDGDGFDGPLGDGADCDDNDSDLNPGVFDIPGNSIDEDCNGVDGSLCVDRPVTIDLNATPPEAPTEGPDVIMGTPGDDTIDGLGGDDFICSGGGNDTVDGGAGNDYIRAGSGDDIVNGGDGDDRLFGVAGDDTMNGDAGEDTLHGNRGKDTLDGGDDDDRVFGYADDDVLNGGDGDDKIFGHFGNDIINGGDGDDRLFGWGDEDTINGGPGDDLISGNFGDDVINGDAGNDTLYGADGDDQVNGGPGNDSVNGNSLNDTLTGGTGNDALDGGINQDSCAGGSGTDTATRCEFETSIP